MTGQTVRIVRGRQRGVVGCVLHEDAAAVMLLDAGGQPWYERKENIRLQSADQRAKGDDQGGYPKLASEI